MAVAVAPMNNGMSAPDMANPRTRDEQAVVNKDRVDKYKQASKIGKALLADEGITMVKARMAGNFQEGQNLMSELEYATAADKRAAVEQFNRALSVAEGNGLIQLLRLLIEGLNTIVDDDEPLKPLPVPAPPPPPPSPTFEKVDVGFRDFWKGHVIVQKNQ